MTKTKKGREVCALNRKEYLLKKIKKLRPKVVLGVFFLVVNLKINYIYAYAKVKENEYDFLTKGGHMFDPITDYLNHILYQITKLGILILIICFLIIIIKKHFRRY